MTKKEYCIGNYDMGKDIAAWEKLHGKGVIYAMSKERYKELCGCSLNAYNQI